MDGPSDSGPGVYTFTAIAEDDSLDPIQYQFSLEPDGGAEVVSPFQDADSIQFVLSPGIWTVRVLAVDNIDCIENEAKDSICETTVEVDEAGENVALGKVTDQSSEYNGGQFPAGFAVDGNFGNFTHTLAGNDALGPAIWEVDLGEDFAIGRVVLHNRASCCGSRLRDVIVSVHDISFREDEALDPLGLESTDYPEPVWPDSIIESELLNAENELAGGDVGAVPAIEADFGGEGVVGRFIRVTRLPDTDLSGTGGVGNADEATVLSLGEVEVYLSGDPVECPQEGEAEFGDTACSGVDASGPAGNGEGTWTFTANATDATDDTIRYEFRAERLGDGASQTRGPSSSNTATFDLTEGDWTITVNVDDDRACDDDGGQTECDVQVTVVGDDPVEIFHRGDGNNSGTLDLTDGILVLNFLFTGGAAPVCFDAADTNDSGALELTDAVVVFGYLFTGGAPPADPGPVDQPCGPDPTGDDLDCATYTNCGN